MSILIIILLLIVGIIVLSLVIALFMKKEHYAKSEIIIHAPPQTVFDYLKLLKNQNKFNKYAKADPNRNWEYKGTDGTVGYIIAWSGNKNAGCGEKEIMNLVEGKKIETEIRFVKPMKTTAKIIMEMELLANNQTKVSWSNAGIIKYPLNIMIPLFEKMFAKDMHSSLLTLKNILEN